MRPSRRRLAPVLVAASPLVLGLASALSRADDAPRPAPAPDEGTRERRRVLENGLEVVAVPSSRAKAVVVVTTFRAGPRDEAKAEAGAAQLVARLWRRSAAGARAAGVAEQELLGLASLVRPSGQGPSGLVGHDVRRDAISEFATAPEDRLASVLEIERDRFTSLAPGAEVLEAARTEVVFKSATAEGQVPARAWNTLLALAWGDCALGRPVEGNPRAASALKLDALDAWRKARLRPDAAVVVIAGVHDGEAALAQAAKVLGSVPRPADPLAPRGAVAPAPTGALRAAIEAPHVGREVWLGYRGPEPGAEDEGAFLALALEVKDRVNQAEKGAATEVHLEVALSDSPSLLALKMLPRPQASVAEIETRATGAIATLRGDKLAQIAPLRDRALKVLAGQTRALDPVLAAKKDDVGILVQLACDRAAAEPLVRRRDAAAKRLAALTPEGLRDAAHFYLGDDRVRVVVVGEK